MTAQELLDFIEKEATKLLTKSYAIVAKYWDEEILEKIEGSIEGFDVYSFIYNNKELREEESNVKCHNCGSVDFQVNLLCSPYTGGYLSLTCSLCGNSRVLLDDYS